MDMNESSSRTGFLYSALVTKLIVAFLVVATVFVGALAINALMDLGDAEPAMGNVITVDGEGRVTAIPDIATISFTVSEQATTGSVAQETATKKMNVALAVLMELAIEDADIKTTSYSISPRYSYQPPCYTSPCPPVEAERIIGYTASQTVEVKVRDTSKAGDVLAKLGDAGVSNLYGPSYTVDDQEGLKAEARKIAVEKARAKAKLLAKDLDVNLSRIVSFWESTGPVYPMYYGKAEGLGGAATDVSVPSLPAGENEIVVNVSVTYEIR